MRRTPGCRVFLKWWILIAFFALSLPLLYGVSPCEASPLFETNLLSNPGFESRLDFWTTDNGTLRNKNPVSHTGIAYLAGGTNNTANSHTYQDVSLANVGFTDALIDSGKYDVRFGGWQASYLGQTDSGMIELRFLDAEDTLLLSADLGWFYSNSIWVQRQTVVSLPTGTRSIRYGFYSKRYEGQNNDAYLDDAVLEIVPEPTSLSLLVLGWLALIRRNRMTLKTT